jgi:hypothetical protein
VQFFQQTTLLRRSGKEAALPPPPSLMTSACDFRCTRLNLLQLHDTRLMLPNVSVSGRTSRVYLPSDPSCLCTRTKPIAMHAFCTIANHQHHTTTLNGVRLVPCSHGISACRQAIRQAQHRPDSVWEQKKPEV